MLILGVEDFSSSQFLEECVESVVVIVVLLSTFQIKNLKTELAVLFFTLYWTRLPYSTFKNITKRG